jgi:hypothetical protein
MTTIALPTTNNNSAMQSTEKYSNDLAVYCDYVEYWSPDCGDAFMMLNARESLALAPSDSLSAADQDTLARADALLLVLAQCAVGDAPDVQFLRLTAQAVIAQQTRGLER